jgi:hypothetical protein
MSIWPEEIERQVAESKVYAAREDEQRRIIVSLLRGGSLLLGKRIELCWPDGPPYGMTNEQLVDWLDGKKSAANGAGEKP